MEIFYIGSFDDSGMHILTLDRTRLVFEHIANVPDLPAPSFQALHPAIPCLYSVSGAKSTANDPGGTVAAYRIDPKSGRLTVLNTRSTKGSGPCHISVDPHGAFAFVSNYGAGSLAVYPIVDNGSLGSISDLIQHHGNSVHPKRQEAPHMHSAIPSPDGRYVYASDLGIDQIRIYSLNREAGTLEPAEPPFVESAPASGPRHLAIHPDRPFAYSAEELSSTVAAYAMEAASGALSPIQRLSMLPENHQEASSAADIHISPDGRFLYASNRGHDSIVIFDIDSETGRLTTVGHESTRGGHPRNFYIDGTGTHLFVANRDNDNIVLFERDRQSGKLRATGAEAHVPKPVCITEYRPR